MRNVLSLVVAALLVILPDLVAIAQTVAPVVPTAGATTVQVLQPTLWAQIQPIIVEVCSAIATALLALIYSWVKAKFHVDVEAKLRETLHSAAVTGINSGVSKIGSMAGGLTIDVKSAIAKTAVDWMEHAAADAIAHFALTPTQIDAFVQAKMQQVLGVTAPVVSPPAGTG